VIAENKGFTWDKPEMMGGGKKSKLFIKTLNRLSDGKIKTTTTEEDEIVCPGDNCDYNLLIQVISYADGCIRRRVKAGINFLDDIFISEDVLDALKGNKFIYTYEFAQDLAFKEALLNRELTPLPTEEEIKDWQYYNELFAKMDCSEVKKKYNVFFLKDEDNPYAEEEYEILRWDKISA
jgi:hypothetical protein